MNATTKEALGLQLIIEEGLKLSPYRCTAGKLTIGVGHNLDDKPISKRAAMFILAEDLDDVCNDLDRMLPWWRQMAEVRQQVLADMCFNMGMAKLLGFVDTLRAMKTGRYDDAAKGMLNSKWAREDVGARATRLAAMMRAGL